MGARYEVMLIFAANGRPDRLDWVRLNPRSEALRAPAAKARPAPYGGLSMGGFLQAAKPEWTQKDITSVLERCWMDEIWRVGHWNGVITE